MLAWVCMCVPTCELSVCVYQHECAYVYMFTLSACVHECVNMGLHPSVSMCVLVCQHECVSMDAHVCVTKCEWSAGVSVSACMCMCVYPCVS